MSVGSVIIVIVLLYISILVVNAISVFWSAPAPRSHEKKYKAFVSNDFLVDLLEYNDAQRLRGLLSSVTNRFCKEQAIIVYFTIQRKYRLSGRRNENNVLQLCMIAILRELNYDKFDIVHSYNDYVDQLDDEQLCQDIKTEASVLINQIQWEDGSLYTYTDAWEIYYSYLIESFSSDNVRLFYDKACWLAEQNTGIMVKRKIYLDSYQFLVEIDREYALRFYLCYLHSSTEIKYRRISVKNRKLLFRKQGEKERFDIICDELLEDKDLEKALRQFDQIQISQRKKISLNIQAIKNAAEKQSKVAGVLSEWLADEEEKPIFKDTFPETDIESPVSKQQENPKDALFQLFISHSYRLNKEEVNIFARSCGLFTSQFVERINEEHFELLDDVLIEEDEDCYILNEDYCRQIKENGN